MQTRECALHIHIIRIVHKRNETRIFGGALIRGCSGDVSGEYVETQI